MEKIRKIVRDIIYEFAEKNDDAKSLKDIANEGGCIPQGADVMGGI